MPNKKKVNIKNEAKKQLQTIADTVDLDVVNHTLKEQGIENIDISKQTLVNIGKWILDGKSEQEIRNNLELSLQEWNFMLKTCPAIVVIMQHSTTYADMIVGGTLLQTAIGGKKIKKKIPMKVHDYNDNGKVIGEHYEMVEVEEETLPNPYLLKFLAENKLSETFGNKKRDNDKEFRDVIENMTDEQISVIDEYKK